MRMLNLCFHGVGDPERALEAGEARYWVRHDFFLEVLDAVRGRDDVRLSFDDGNVSDLSLGLPALRDRGLRATFFPLAGRVGTRGSLSGAALRELRGAGMTIGSHGFDHVPWRHLPPAARRRELVDARRVLVEASGGQVEEAALPLGRYDRRSLAWVRAAGYRKVYSSDRLPARGAGWFQPRYSVRADDTTASVAAVLVGPTAAAHAAGLLRVSAKRLR